jgi:Ca2+-binding EF-hand superfamily protein
MKTKILAALGAASFLAFSGGAFAQGAGGPGMMFASMDTNKDGKITVAEAQAARTAQFDKEDANKDGFVTSEEMGERGAMMLTRADKNKDGKLDKAEFTDTAGMFTFMDTNKDGAIDQAEVAAMPPMPRPGG